MGWNWLKHAFAVESAESFEPTPRQRTLAEALCREVHRRGLATPALAFLEMSRPLNQLGAQTLHFFQPFLSVFTSTDDARVFAEFLEHRGSIECLCRMLEDFQSQATGAERRRE